MPEFGAVDWIALFAPPGTSAEVVETLHAKVASVTRDPQYLETMKTIMLEPLTAGPKESAAQLLREYNVWQPVVKDSGCTT